MSRTEAWSEHLQTVVPALCSPGRRVASHTYCQRESEGPRDPMHAAGTPRSTPASCGNWPRWSRHTQTQRRVRSGSSAAPCSSENVPDPPCPTAEPEKKKSKRKTVIGAQGGIHSWLVAII